MWRRRVKNGGEGGGGRGEGLLSLMSIYNGFPTIFLHRTWLLNPPMYPEHLLDPLLPKRMLSPRVARDANVTRRRKRRRITNIEHKLVGV